MSLVCRICLVGNTSLNSVINKQLLSCYEKLTNAKFNSEEARPRALCCFCYQKLLRCHSFSQMALRSEKICSYLYARNLGVTPDILSELKFNIKQCLSVPTMTFVTIDGNSTNTFSQVTIKDEPLPNIGINEELTAAHDKLLEVESIPVNCSKSQITFKENNTDREENTQEILSNTHIEQSKLDDSSFTIKDEPLLGIDIKKEMTTELDKLVEIDPFPEHGTKSQLTFEDSDQEKDVEELIKNHVDQAKQDQSKMPFSCKECNKIFLLKCKLISHINNSHSQVKGNKYSLLRSTLSSKNQTETSVSADETKHNQKNKLTCHVCAKTFVSKSNLIHHMRIHTGEKPFACNVCDKQFIEKHHVVSHMRVHTGEKPFTCHVCDKQITHKSYLVSHMRTHTEEKPFFCHVCEKIFCDNSTLNKHMRIHTGVKSFVCNVCEKQFNRKDNLNYHRRIHTGEKQFACNVCDKQFQQKGTLVSHMRTHTGEKPFFCHICKKGFSRKSILDIHLKIHTGVEPSCM